MFDIVSARISGEIFARIRCRWSRYIDDCDALCECWLLDIQFIITRTTYRREPEKLIFRRVRMVCVRGTYACLCAFEIEIETYCREFVFSFSFYPSFFFSSFLFCIQSGASRPIWWMLCETGNAAGAAVKGDLFVSFDKIAARL